MLLNPNIILRVEFDHYGVLFNPDNGETKSINPVGVLIWQGLDSGLSKDQILQTVIDSCDNVPESLAADYDEFIQTLIQNGYLAD